MLTHQEYLINRITEVDPFPVDQLSSSGLEGSAGGEPAVRSVVGGAGSYKGATGEVVQHTTGSNITDGPNFRFEFSFAKHGL